ncbi:hypothetical protein ACIQGO_16305 [Streptomyces shenzhenensis]|uniref:hypothetical protein n=1 Tax=Streptomyces shenzhenensis TaxID=943815 RepID=UPI00380EFE5A
MRAAAVAVPVLNVPALGVAAPLLPGRPAGMSRDLVALWFALPLILARHATGAGGERTHLAPVAVRGIRAVGEPGLRAATGPQAGPPGAHGEHWRRHRRTVLAFADRRTKLPSCRRSAGAAALRRDTR